MLMNDYKENAPKVKCVVWDLDNTLWNGVLMEDEQVTLRDGIVEVIKTLDERGILQSIASKNDASTALSKLEELGLLGYFLYPQIGWNPKSESINKIRGLLNIGINTFAFIDDDPYERGEVNFAYPEVRCIDISEIQSLSNRPDMKPNFISSEARLRRSMYLADMQRRVAEQDFTGPQESFLATLQMTMNISCAKEDDLLRAEELTYRTHQLNTTGYTYSFEELDQFRQSHRYRLLVARLNDKYGAYGTIGLALLERLEDVLTIKLLLMSCRVMSRGVGTILLIHIMRMAKAERKRLQAEYVPNGRNRQMYVTYKFAGFREVAQSGELSILESDLSFIQPFPDYVKVQVE